MVRAGRQRAALLASLLDAHALGQTPLKQHDRRPGRELVLALLAAADARWDAELAPTIRLEKNLSEQAGQRTG
jgi:hypothetical protein